MGVWARGLVLALGVVLVGCERVGTADNPLNLEIPDKDLDYIETNIGHGMWMRIAGQNLLLSEVLRIYDDDSGYLLLNKSESDLLIELTREGLYRDGQALLANNGYHNMGRLSAQYSKDWCKEIADAGSISLTIVESGEIRTYFGRCSDYFEDETQETSYDQVLSALIESLQTLTEPRSD